MIRRMPGGEPPPRSSLLGHAAPCGGFRYPLAGRTPQRPKSTVNETVVGAPIRIERVTVGQRILEIDPITCDRAHKG